MWISHTKSSFSNQMYSKISIHILLGAREIWELLILKDFIDLFTVFFFQAKKAGSLYS